jgi:hypothetical protein
MPTTKTPQLNSGLRVSITGPIVAFIRKTEFQRKFVTEHIRLDSDNTLIYADSVRAPGNPLHQPVRIGLQQKWTSTKSVSTSQLAEGCALDLPACLRIRPGAALLNGASFK